MDAVEFEKARFRMCRDNLLKHGYCEPCDAYNFETRRCGFVPRSLGSRVDDEDVIKKNIATVENWSKANPIKTRQSEFLKQFPNADLTRLQPCIIEKDKRPTRCIKYIDEEGHALCDECRNDYWNEEVTDND